FCSRLLHWIGKLRQARRPSGACCLESTSIRRLVSIFALETMTLRRTAYSISTQEATRNTLMGALLGDVFVGLRVGTRYTLGVRKIGPEREGGEFLGIITQDR